jgi:hypothetical protein
MNKGTLLFHNSYPNKSTEDCTEEIRKVTSTGLTNLSRCPNEDCRIDPVPCESLAPATTPSWSTTSEKAAIEGKRPHFKFVFVEDCIVNNRTRIRNRRFDNVPERICVARSAHHVHFARIKPDRKLCLNNSKTCAHVSRSPTSRL